MENTSGKINGKIKPRSKSAVESAAERPQALPVNPDGIPDELKERDQWVCWRYEWRKDAKGGGKWTKVPIDPGTGRKARANDPSTWGSFGAALERCQSDGLDGIGFEFSADDPYCGVDLDDCRDRDGGGVTAWGQDFLDRLDSYSEVSPSGTGAKVVVKGQKPGDRCSTKYETGKVEIYDRGRFFALTGQRLEGTPATVNDRQAPLEEVYRLVFGGEGRAEAPGPATSAAAAAFLAEAEERAEPPSPAPLTDEEVIAKARGAKDGAKFTALWAGDTGEYPSASEADQALCNLLAFWCRKDADQMDRLFRRSGLMRPKWDEKRGESTYGRKTIKEAIDFVTAVYDGTPPQSEAAAAKAPTPSAPSYKLGDLTLRRENPRRTEKSAKVCVTVCVPLPGGRCRRIPVTDSLNGQREAARELKRLAPGVDPEPVLDQILADAAAAADRPPDSGGGPTIADIIAEKVPPRFRLAFKTDRGAYSESRKGEVTAGDFARHVPRWLRAECAQATDAPKNPLTLMKLIKAELECLFATELEKLPTEDQANYGPDSPAARRFVGELEKVLTCPTTFEVARGSTGTPAEGSHAAKTNLVERIRDEATLAEKRNPRKKTPFRRMAWVKVQKAFDVWWKLVTARGKTHVLIALRHRIAYQTQAAKCLPGVFDQASLRRQCERSGILFKGRTAGERLSDGTRLVVLSPAFTRKLLGEAVTPRDPSRNSTAH
jgi:hypothetical protein